MSPAERRICFNLERIVRFEGHPQLEAGSRSSSDSRW